MSDQVSNDPKELGRDIAEYLRQQKAVERSTAAIVPPQPLTAGASDRDRASNAEAERLYVSTLLTRKASDLTKDEQRYLGSRVSAWLRGNK